MKHWEALDIYLVTHLSAKTEVCDFKSDPVNVMVFFGDHYSEQKMHFKFRTLKNDGFKVIVELSEFRMNLYK